MMAAVQLAARCGGRRREAEERQCRGRRRPPTGNSGAARFLLESCRQAGRGEQPAARRQNEKASTFPDNTLSAGRGRAGGVARPEERDRRAVLTVAPVKPASSDADYCDMQAMSYITVCSKRVQAAVQSRNVHGAWTLTRGGRRPCHPSFYHLSLVPLLREGGPHAKAREKRKGEGRVAAF